MQSQSSGRRWALALLLCAVAGCGGKSTAEVEAERAKANAEWEARTAEAERVRQAEVDRLVKEELAAHEQREQSDAMRENQVQLSRRDAEKDRLQSLVLAGTADPQSARLSDVRWNGSNTALCGTVSEHDSSGVWSHPVAFVASGDEAAIDAADASSHARFLEAAQTHDCSP